MESDEAKLYGLPEFFKPEIRKPDSDFFIDGEKVEIINWYMQLPSFMTFLSDQNKDNAEFPPFRVFIYLANPDDVVIFANSTFLLQCTWNRSLTLHLEYQNRYGNALLLHIIKDEKTPEE